MLPTPGDRFAWDQTPCGPVLRCRALEAHAHHVFTTRALALSSPNSESLEGWRLLAASFGVPGSRFVLPKQVHGTSAVVVRAGTRPPLEAGRPVGDVVVTDDPEVVIAVQVADCVPILLAEPSAGVVAAVHAGWRGTLAGASAAAIAAMQREFGAAPAGTIAALGPSIGVDRYEVGDDVHGAFGAAYGGREAAWFRRRGTRWHLDLWRANRDQLEAAGVGSDRIHVAGLCTASHTRVFHSYRAEKGAGRMAAAIRLRPRRPGP